MVYSARASYRRRLGSFYLCIHLRSCFPYSRMCAPGCVYVWITFGPRLVHRISIFIPNTKTTMKMAFRWAVLMLHSTNQRSETRGPITEIFRTIIELVDCRLGQYPWRNVYPHITDTRTASPAGVVLKSHPLHNYTRLQAKNARGVQLRCTLRVQINVPYNVICIYY